ncbi:hypothetical protein AAHA92_33773 [Salvia divinorum]|uniref:Uncharacterized protein n=1 Tax=Salvia divinorum TaxID=28513 RepID=A0ABD1FGS2_SALDI
MLLHARMRRPPPSNNRRVLPPVAPSDSSPWSPEASIAAACRLRCSAALIPARTAPNTVEFHVIHALVTIMKNAQIMWECNLPLGIWIELSCWRFLEL